MPLLMLAPILSGLAGCGPIPVDQAERICREEALYRDRPRTQVSIGLGGGGDRFGGYGSVSMDVDPDRIMGRGPEEAYEHCVRRRSGQSPARPLFQQEGGTAKS
ncbi:MAG: hypothetical protein ACK5L9_07940 [Paracoccus sp. (in: a-proteobacteria)]